MTTPSTDLQRLGRPRFDEIVETLCAAFHEYPVMRYVLKDAGDAYDAHLRELVGWFTDKRIARGLPALGVTRGGRMLGAANLDPPHTVPAPPELQERYLRLATRVGGAAMARLLAYEEACAPLLPREPHYYLGMLGVRPDAQGQGLGRMLLEAVQVMSSEDPASRGVVLTTETPTNLPFYQHFGFSVVGRSNAEELDTWTLFRSDQDAPYL